MDQYDKNQYDRLVSVNIEEEMKKSYIDYAMSVIVARALPDVRDGLKPVHRRILYSMNELNLDPNKAYKKSARIVGDTMGKYHPHGNSSIYDAMVRMAQSFSMRYPLVDGHGNFGSMDGDGAAAERYTEARLSRMAVEMIADIEKETVDFIPNYDGEFAEPVVLPSRFPNLLVNGSAGIAVGMATNIPPHNLTEIIDGLLKIIDSNLEDTEVEISDLLDIIKGPDFPTGASILGVSGIKQAYRTGRGKVVVRAVASIEPMSTNREMIVITELPYQVNKAKLIERIAELVKDKKIEGISDLRDETDRNGVRIVIEIKKDANANVVLNQLYKFTSCQESFGVIMLALVNNEPEVLNLMQMLTHYLDHQKEVVARRTTFELNKAKKRAHILEGLVVALDNIDEVLNIIRSSKDVATARERLIERFDFSDEQASAIVDMRFRSLTGMERSRLEEELNDLKLLIQELTEILEDNKRLLHVVKEELLITKTKYGDARRTQIIYDSSEIDYEDLIDEETSVITMTHLDYVKRIPLTAYRSQNRGGKGVIGMQMRDEDLIKDIFVASTHDNLLYFTNKGRVYSIKAYEIPEAGRTAKGIAIVNLLNLNGGEKITAVIPIKDHIEYENFIMITKRGLVKKIKASEFDNIKKAGRVALNIREDDELITVLENEGGRDIFIATALGKGIRFKDAIIRTMGRQASGVRAVNMADGDYVVGAGLLCENDMLLFVSENGYGKCTVSEEFSNQGRGGKGKIIYKVTQKTGNVVGVCTVSDKDELMIINSEGVIIRLRIADISVVGRYAMGVKLINLDESVNVVSIAKIAQDQIDTEISEDDLQPDPDIDIE